MWDDIGRLIAQSIANRLREQVIEAVKPELDKAINAAISELAISLMQHDKRYEVVLTDNREKRG